VCPDSYKRCRNESRLHKQEQAIWQRRFWEHQIRDEHDLNHHIDYIHYNPVHHGLVKFPKDWQYSSFHQYVKRGECDIGWGMGDKIVFRESIGYE
jgi:putative transposase